MGKELLEKLNNDNYKIVNELIEIISYEKINTKDQLKDYQDKLFKIEGKVMNNSEKILRCINQINDAIHISEGLDFIEFQKFINMKKQLKTVKEEEKIKLIIKIFNTLGLEMMFPYEAYNLIVNNEL